MSYFGYGTTEQEILDAIGVVCGDDDVKAAKATARVLEYLVGLIPDRVPK